MQLAGGSTEVLEAGLQSHCHESHEEYQKRWNYPWACRILAQAGSVNEISTDADLKGRQQSAPQCGTGQATASGRLQVGGVPVKTTTSPGFVTPSTRSLASRDARMARFSNVQGSYDHLLKARRYLVTPSSCS